MSKTTELMRRTNPVAGGSRGALSARAERDLANILATAQTLTKPHRKPGPRALFLVASGVAAVLAIALIVLTPGLGGDGQSAYAATPPLLVSEHAPTSRDARADLEELAKRIENLPDDTGRGDVAQVTIKSWSLFTRIDDNQVRSQVVPIDTTTRTRADGTATIERSYNYNGQQNESQVVTSALEHPLRGLSSNIDTLRRQLAVGQPSENGTAGLFDSIVVANRQMPLEPAVRAAVLRLLATAPGIETVGEVTDRAGRSGVGFTVDSDFSGLPTRYTLIFNPENGRLLGYEEMLTRRDGKLNVRVPAVINYQVFVSSRYMAES